MADAIPRHVALVSESGSGDPRRLKLGNAALQKQVTRALLVAQYQSGHPKKTQCRLSCCRTQAINHIVLRRQQ